MGSANDSKELDCFSIYHSMNLTCAGPKTPVEVKLSELLQFLLSNSVSLCSQEERVM